MLRIQLLRAWACFWIMEGIGAAAYPLPKRYRVRVINTLCRPFFGYGAYWAFRSNPNVRAEVIRREQGNPTDVG